METVFKFIGLVLVSYFVGNFNFARLIASSRKSDITSNGSGNPGTMNMLRNHGFIAGAMTLLFDALKCVVPCIVGYYIMQPSLNPELAMIALYVAAIACVLGHNYPAVYGFKGGKGVASSFGFAVVANWWLALACFGVFAIVLVVTRIAAISTLSACLVYVVVISILLISKGYYVCFGLLMFLFAIVLFAHRKNFQRIFTRKEKKIDLKASAEKDREFLDKLLKDKKSQTSKVKEDVEFAEMNEETAKEVEQETKKKQTNTKNKK